MSVKEIDNIIIPGYTQYGLYSFDYNPGFADSPGIIEAQFINKSGDYPNTNVFVHSFFPIYVKNDSGIDKTLGQFTAISTETQETDKYKSLTVKFADKSVELDRYLVALRGQIGYDSVAYNNLPSLEKSRVIGVAGSGRVIWVGSSEDQCKENILGAQDGVDPCDPCSEKLSDPQLRQLDCEKYYLHNKRIYRYTFNELLSAISSRIGISMGAVAASSTLKFEYVGTVREVLNNICAEIGLTFYYDPTLNKVNFVSTQVGIDINIKNLELEVNKCKILSKTIKHSRENSRDVWGVASFSRDAEEKRYGCGLNSCKKLRMAPFTLTDILGEPGHFAEESGVAGFKRLEFYSTLNARLGKDVRDLFIWLQEYDFKKASDIEDNFLNKKLKKLNGMTIKKVFHAKSSDTKSKFIYRLLMRSLTSKDFDNIKDRAEKKKTYFFLAEVDPVYEEKVNNFEVSIANNFLGRFWIRYFKQHWKGLSYQTLSPDGSVQYYDFKTPINLPFADMIYEAYGSLTGSPLLDRSGFDDIASGNTPDSLVARDTFFLMDRPASFWPVAIADEELSNLNKNIQDYIFKEFSTPIDLSNKFKKYFGIENYDPKTHKVFKVDLDAGELDFDLNIDDNIEHPAESENVKINVNACGKYTSYGLRDADTRKFTIKLGDFQTELFMPVQSHVRESGDHSGYTILVERSGVDANYIIPKAEVFSYSAVPQSSSAKLGIDLNFFNATTNDLNLLSVIGGDNFCDMNLAQINTLLGTLSKQLTHFTGNTEERSYRIEGFPVDFYSPADGLKSFSVSAGSGGLTTSLTFSNTAPFKASIDSFLKKLQYMRLSQVNRPFPTGTFNNSVSNDLPEIGE